MKKLLAFLAAFMMIVTYCSALAETADTTETEYATYSNTTFGYQIKYPSGWILVDMETINEYIQQAAEGEFTREGVSAFALDTMKLMMANAPEDGLIEFLDGLGNSIAVTSSDFATPGSLEMANAGISPLVITYYQTFFTDVVVLDSGSITTYGDREYLQLIFQFTVDNTVNTQTLLYYFQNDIAYSLIFTWVSADDETMQEMELILEAVLNSFALEM